MRFHQNSAFPNPAPATKYRQKVVMDQFLSQFLPHRPQAEIWIIFGIVPNVHSFDGENDSGINSS